VTIRRNTRSRRVAACGLAVFIFAHPIPATLAFADTSTVTISIVEPPVTRTSVDRVYDPALDGEALVLTTTMIAQLP
jgi:hypothetical protein